MLTDGVWVDDRVDTLVDKSVGLVHVPSDVSAGGGVEGKQRSEEVEKDETEHDETILMATVGTDLCGRDGRDLA